MSGLLLGVLAVTAIGCGGGEKKLPVTVTLTYKGNPLADTRVNLMAANGSVSFATTDASGKASNFVTESPGDGVPLGKYQVTLAPPPEPVADEITDASAYDVKPPADLKFPRKYLTNGSGLTVEVTESNSDFTLELTD